MILKTKIYTTSNPKWVTKNLPFIEECFRKAKNLTVHTIEIEQIKLDKLPTIVKKGDVIPDWAWLKQNIFEQGYNAVGLHLSRKDRRKFKLANLGGSFNTEFDDVLDFYIVADEGQKTPGYDFDNFTRIVLHEVGHGFDNWKYGKPNIHVHTWDYDLKKIHELPAQYDFSDMPKLQIINLINLIWIEINRLMGQVRPCVPPLDPQWKVSQNFGVPNSRYPLTKHHVGVDYSVPIGTACFAIADGAISKIGTTKALGNYCYYQFYIQNQLYTARYLHLSKKPIIGKYAKGAVIGFTGNTGEVTGAHLHIDVMKGAFDLTGINPTNFKERFVDPQSLWN